MLFEAGLHSPAREATPFAPAIALALFGWLGFAAGSVAGLLSRSRTALCVAVFLTAASALAVGGPLLMRLVETGSLPLSSRTLVMLGGLACFLAPLCLLIAGRRDYLARC